jgi:uncharacterized membrane protein YhiD involved in acid resistance
MFDAITLQNASENTNIATLIFTILLAFMLSSSIAFVYQKTFRGTLYSRNYVQTIILISIIVTIIIQAIGDSFARGLGVMAAMSIIRFRNNLKDPRDLLFIFASLAVGVSCGTYSFGIAIIGTLGFLFTVIILYFSPLGLQNDFDGMLKFSLPSDGSDQSILKKFMAKYCQHTSLMDLKDEGDNELSQLAYSYHIRLKQGVSYELFMAELKRLSGIKNIHIKMIGAAVKNK